MSDHLTTTVEPQSLAKQLLAAHEKVDELEETLSNTRAQQGNPFLLRRMMDAEDAVDILRADEQRWAIDRANAEGRIERLLAAEPDKIKQLRADLRRVERGAELAADEALEDSLERERLEEWVGHGRHPLRAGVIARIGRRPLPQVAGPTIGETLTLSNTMDDASLGLDFTPIDHEHRVTLDWREVQELVVVLNDWLDRVGRP